MNELVLLLSGPWLVAFVVPFVIVWRWRHARAAEARRRALLGARLPAVAGALHRPRLRLAAECGMLTALAVALLGPAVPGDQGQGGADLVVCLDVSWSMAARDEAPSRLAAAQQALHALAGVHAESRLGLVAFAGSAAVHSPLTPDVEAVAALAGELFAGGVGQGGSDPGAAIARAVELLQRGGRAGAVVVVGDGEDFVDGAATAAAAARAAGFAVHTVACGSASGSKIVVPQRDGDERFLRRADGSEVVTRCELDALQAWAAAGGGRCRHVAPDVLRELHDDVVLPAARAVAVRAGRLAPVSLVHWPLLLAVLFWMLRQWLPERTR